MRLTTVATLALGLLFFACSGGSGSSSPVIETTQYPGGDMPPLGPPPTQQDSAAPLLGPPMLLCPGDDGPDGCADGGGSDASGDGEAGMSDVASPGDGEAGIVCPSLDTIACGMPLHEPQAPCPTYDDVRTWCAQGAATSELIDPCDGLLIVSVVEGIDSSAIYCFDSGTKQLVGVAIEGNSGGPFCVGGVTGFNAARAFSPNCPSETTHSFDDAGVCASLARLDASLDAGVD